MHLFLSKLLLSDDILLVTGQKEKFLCAGHIGSGWADSPTLVCPFF